MKEMGQVDEEEGQVDKGEGQVDAKLRVKEKDR